MQTAPEAANLVENYFPLARKVAAHWATAYPHLASEFESEAAMELWRTATAFDPAKGVRFATLFHHNCRFAFLRVLKRERTKAPLAFLPQSAPMVEGEQFSPIDLAVSRELAPDEAVELAEDHPVSLPDLLDTLPADRRDLVTRRFLEGCGYAELGKERGTTGVNVRQLVAKSLLQMRKAAGE